MWTTKPTGDVPKLCWQTTNNEGFTIPPEQLIKPDPMELTAPLQFEPLFMERVWGGRQLEQLYGKRLPQGARIGEAWEIVDREEAQSVVHSGPLQGETLHELWTNRHRQIFGPRAPDGERFPLLIKLLDAQDRLSVQVHPPQSVAASLKGEPKTEMWYFASTLADADIFAGLRKGVTRDSFETALREGTVAEQVHRITVKSGDAIFIPSGRIHAIGAGNVIVEVQQNSDTTYRVFDWNRFGLDGRPRELHVSESLASIDFDDIEPGLAQPKGQSVVDCELFQVERLEFSTVHPVVPEGEFAIVCVLEGKVKCGSEQFEPGEFFLMPANLSARTMKPMGGNALALRITIP